MIDEGREEKEELAGSRYDGDGEDDREGVLNGEKLEESGRWLPVYKRRNTSQLGCQQEW